MTDITWAQQTLSCGNAFYDDGAPVSALEGSIDADWVGAVRFELADFGYQPGRVEIAGFCVGDAFFDYNSEGGGEQASEVFIYPDAHGRPDVSVVLGRGTIHVGGGRGASTVMLDEPVILQGDFWIVNRGFTLLNEDAEPDGGRSYLSNSGIGNLQPASQWAGVGDFCLRALLQPVRRSYHTGGVARASGAHGSQWRTKLTALNTGDAPSRATLTYLYGSSTVEATIELGVGELRAWDDVVAELFGVAGESSGAIRVEADEPVLVNARTCNASAEGTFGQFMPGVEVGDAMTSGQLGRLSLLSNTAAFRTNVGFLNLGGDPAGVRITLHDASGAVVGSQELQIPAGRWRQLNDVFVAVGAGEVANGYATVEVLSDGGTVWGYASVIDNSTGDPTMVPLAIQ
jgi:hypothetical protein